MIHRKEKDLPLVEDVRNHGGTSLELPNQVRMIRQLDYEEVPCFRPRRREDEYQVKSKVSRNEYLV